MTPAHRNHFGRCNKYILVASCSSGSDTLDRFIWVLSFLARNDFVVIPVDQLQYDDGVLVDRHTWGKVGALTPFRVCTLHSIRSIHYAAVVAHMGSCSVHPRTRATQ